MRLFFGIGLSFLVLFYTSCSILTGTTQAKTNINGSWVLKTIVVEGNKTQSAIMLNEADIKCFTGSIWSFNNTTGLGNYIIKQANGEGCPNLTRIIQFSIIENSGQLPMVQIVKLAADLKPISGENAYNFFVLSNTPNTLQLKNTFEINGTPITLTCNFEKIKL